MTECVRQLRGYATEISFRQAPTGMVKMIQ